MNLTLCHTFNAETSIRSILLLKDKTADLLGLLILRFHQKYELKMGYAEFLLTKIQEQDVNPLTAYGCLVFQRLRATYHDAGTDSKTEISSLEFLRTNELKATVETQITQQNMMMLQENSS